MPDLVLQRQDRVIDFLRRHGSMTTRAIAEHFEWTFRHASDVLASLERRHLLQSRPTMLRDFDEGKVREWMTTD